MYASRNISLSENKCERNYNPWISSRIIKLPGNIYFD
jgi:hypothetical protein